jgi:AcrR family transcriptional regulator
MCARPRTPQDPVLAATVELIAEHGISGVTVDTVATTAGVSKATIYRHWGSRAQLIHAAISGLQRPSPEPDTGAVREDLIALLHQLVEYLSGRDSGGVYSSFNYAASRDPELAILQRETLRAHRSGYERALRRGIARGELPASLDVELFIDLLVSPFIYRRIVAQRQLQPADIAPVVDTVLGATTAAPTNQGAAPSGRST